MEIAKTQSGSTKLGKRKMKKVISRLFAAGLLCAAASANASLYTSDFGTQLADPSNCDDCFTGPFAFSGNNQSINFFGTIYSDLYVSSNGYVTFGSGETSFTSAALNTQTVAPMIAGSYTDLDSRNDAASNVYINTATAGQIIVTYQDMGHFSGNYDVRSTFQIVVRSDQFTVANGEGQIGFFYGTMTDPSRSSAGFGDGLNTINPGEVALASLVPGNTLVDLSARFFNLDGGIPVDVPPTDVPEPAGMAIFGLGLLGFAASRRKAAKKQVSAV